MNPVEQKKAKPIHLLSVGPFGEKAGLIFREMMPQVVVTPCTAPDSTHPSYWPDARIRLVVAWRPVPWLLRLVNHMSYAWRIPFVPALIEQSELVIGPAIIPGLSACHDCYERRVLQHCARPEARAALMRYYDANPESGPKGHLKVFADLAAVRLAQVVLQLESEPHQVAGKIWQFDLMRRQSTMSTVVGLHGCAYCGLHRDERTRSYALLHSELAPLLSMETEPELAAAMAFPGAHSRRRPYDC